MSWEFLACREAILFPGAFRQLAIANYQGIGDSTDGPFENKNSTLQFLNNTSITRGKHSFRFGGEIRKDQFNQVGNQFGRGSFGFSVTPTQDPRALTAGSGLPQQGDAFASFLLGNVTLTEVAAQIAAAQFRATSFALYVDDVWKITPQLTLSLGLRYENTPPWEDISGNLTTVFFNAFDNTPNVADQSRYPVFLRQGVSSGDPYAGLRVRWPNNPLVQDGRLGNRLVNRDNNDFAPRIGIAWSPTPKWVVRTGAGMFYNQDQGNPRFDVARNAAGRTRNDDNPDFPTETWANGASALSGSVANIFTPQALLEQVRPPHALLDSVDVQRAARTQRITCRSRQVFWVGQPSPGVVPRRQRSRAGTGIERQPVTRIRIGDCWCWSRTADAATTTRWERN